MAQVYCTGPALFYVQFPGESTPKFLGTAEREPSIDIRPAFSPVLNDLGGQRVPFDMIYDGEEAFVSGLINRFNESVYAQLAARPAHLAGRRGNNISGEIGTLMVQEGKAVTLWVQFPYVAKAAMLGGLMPAGYRFRAAYLEGPDALRPLGTTARKIGMMFHAIRIFSAVDGSFALYDHDMTGLPGID